MGSLSESFEEEVNTEETGKNNNATTSKSSTKRSYPNKPPHHGNETSSKRSCSIFGNEESQEELGSSVQNVSTDSDEQYTLSDNDLGKGVSDEDELEKAMAMQVEKEFMEDESLSD